jgi:hypothetical protein
VCRMSWLERGAEGAKVGGFPKGLVRADSSLAHGEKSVSSVWCERSVWSTWLERGAEGAKVGGFSKGPQDS